MESTAVMAPDPFVPIMSWYAGVDLGATNLRAVVAPRDGDVAGSSKRPTPDTTGIDVTETILATLREACSNAGITPAELTAAGVGTFGPLDKAEGVVRNPANLPDRIETIPLTGPLKNLIDGPVYLHNDANAGVIGERFYADESVDDMVYLTISSGIGAGVVVDGEVLHGWDGNAGEIGHIPLDSDGGLRCGCGKRGHWEAYCSGNNIPRYAEFLHDGEETALPVDDSGQPDDEPGFSAADVFELAGEEEFADAVLDRVVEWNARGITTIVHSYAPMVIYVGGAVALNNPWLVDRLRDRVPELVMTNVPDIRMTSFGDAVVANGALASAMTRGTGDRRVLNAQTE